MGFENQRRRLALPLHKSCYCQLGVEPGVQASAGHPCEEQHTGMLRVQLQQLGAGETRGDRQDQGDLSQW